MQKQYFEIYLDGELLASAGNSWASAIKWQRYYAKEYPMRKVSIKRTGAPYFEGVIRWKTKLY